jgi:hypothetical protein
MKQALAIPALFVIIIALTFGFTGFGQRNKKSTKGPVWEYKKIACSIPQGDLDKMGADGWELVTSASDSGCFLYFKRQKEQ